MQTEHFDRFVKRNGEIPLSYMRRLGPCPNTHRNVVTGFEPDGDCALCGGVGEIFESVDMGEIIAGSRCGGKMMLVNASLSKQKQPIELAVGDLQCTYLPDDYDMASGDRLTLNSRDEWATESLVRGAGDTDPLRYWPILSIRAVVSEDGSVSSSDYQVSSDGRSVEWLTSIDVGKQYTIRYRYRPQWVVADGSHLRRIEPTVGTDRFPNRCILRLWQANDTDVKEDDL